MSTATHQCLLRRALLAAPDCQRVENTPPPVTTAQKPVIRYGRYGPGGSRYDMNRRQACHLSPDDC